MEMVISNHLPSKKIGLIQLKQPFNKWLFTRVSMEVIVTS